MKPVIRMWSRVKSRNHLTTGFGKKLALLGMIAGGCCTTVNPVFAQRLTFMSTTFSGGTNAADLSPTCLVAADINGDGRPDLISVNGGGTVLTVATNNGGGGFEFSAPIKVGSAVVWAVAADVNGDHKPDLICANGASPGTLTVLTNNGSGSFGSNATLAVGYGPICVTAADVNGDQKVDLISADLYGNTLTVYTNNGSGGFGFSATISAGPNPISVVAADLHGDGKIDLICANEFANTVTVLTNNGRGIFGSNATYNVGSQPISVVAVDVNGDGKLDLVTANYGSASGNTLTVLTNNGSGVFGSNATLVVGAGPKGVVAADVNGDGKMDLICANSQDNTLTVLTNNGAGGFGTNTTLWEGEDPDCLVAADVNGDGRMDLISGDRYTGLTVQTQVGFTVYRYAVSPETYSFVAVDVNNDHKPDLITPNPANNTLTVLTNNGSGIFGSNATLHLGAQPLLLATADINGDHQQDLICASPNALTLFTNNAGGGFGSNDTFIVGTSPTSVAPVDINGDGKVGLAVTISGELVLFANNGSGVFSSNATLEVGNAPGFVVAADVNGDGKPDLICANALIGKPNDPHGALLVFLNNGGGGFVSNATYEVGSGPRSIVAVDVNGDGKLDLICANEASDTVSVLTNSGSGTFGSNATYAVGHTPISVVAADINGDGWPDLITANFSANYDVSTLTMLTNNGSGVFGLFATITVDTQPIQNSTPTYIVAADVNNDGKPDLIITSLIGTLTVLINTIAFPTPPTPLKLGATFSGPNGLVFPWSSPATNIVVQTNSDLTGPNWGTATYPISTTNGTNHSITIPAAPGNLFFRLKQ